MTARTQRLRDQVRLKLHLASLDAKKTLSQLGHRFGGQRFDGLEHRIRRLRDEFRTRLSTRSHVRSSS
jgi:hypothetical protein